MRRPTILPAGVPQYHRGPAPEDFEVMGRKKLPPSGAEVALIKAHYRQSDPNWVEGAEPASLKGGKNSGISRGQSSIGTLGAVWRSKGYRRAHEGSQRGNDMASYLPPGAKVGVWWVDPRTAPAALWSSLPDPETDTRQAGRRSMIAQADIVKAPIYAVFTHPLYARTITYGVVAGYREVFAFSGAQAWKTRILLDEPAPCFVTLKKAARDTTLDLNREDAPHVAAATKIRAEILQKLTPEGAEDRWPVLDRKYREHVAMLLKARALQLDIKPATFAKAWSSGATVRDLTDPFQVTMVHALFVSLLLNLETPKAARVIAFGALLEHRHQWITERMAADIYTNAASAMARVAPGWAATGALTDWHAHGGMERFLRAEGFRLSFSMLREEPQSAALPLTNVWPDEAVPSGEDDED